MAYCSLLLCLINTKAKAQASEVQGWIIQSPTSLVLTNVGSSTTMTSSSSNTNPRAIAPKVVLLPCDFPLGSEPYMEVAVNYISYLVSNNSQIILGFQTKEDSVYHFTLNNTFKASCPTDSASLELRTFSNGAQIDMLVGFCPLRHTPEPDLLKIKIKNAGGSLYKLELFRNGTRIAGLSDLSLTDGRFFVELRDNVAGTKGMNGGASLREIIANYPCTNTTFFSELKTGLDGSFAQMYDDTLRIKFIQEYATAAVGTPDNIPFKIYNWNLSTNNSSTFQANYGVNWVKIPIASLPANTYYTLEAVGNKQEKYFLRFKR